MLYKTIFVSILDDAAGFSFHLFQNCGPHGLALAHTCAHASHMVMTNAIQSLHARMEAAEAGEGSEARFELWNIAGG